MNTPKTQRLSPGVRRAAVVIIIGAIASYLDSTIVNVAIRSLSLELHTDLDTVQWVITAYLLALAAVIPLTGWAAKRVGARRLYLTSVVLFTAGSLLCGAAQSPGQLIAFRVVQGLGGGMVLPVGQIILARIAGPQNMAKVMSVVGVPMVLTPVVGPTIGGLLLDGPGWRWIFFINLPICVLAVIAGLRLLPRDEAENAGPLDLAGLLLISTGLVALTYGLAELGSSGRLSEGVVVSLAGGAVLLVAFVLWALRCRRPLLDLRLYGSGGFSAASLATFCLGGAMYGGMILMPLYFQTVRGESALATGLLLGPSGLGAAAAMRLSGRATERWGGGVTALIGGAISIVATIPFVLVGAGTSYVYLIAAMTVRGFGIGMSLVPAMAAAYRVLGRSKINDATPQLSILQRVGGSIGTAIIAVVLQNHLAAGATTPQARAEAFGTTFWWVLGVSAVAMLSTALLAKTERPAFAAQRTQGAPQQQAAASAASTASKTPAGGS